MSVVIVKIVVGHFWDREFPLIGLTYGQFVLDSKEWSIKGQEEITTPSMSLFFGKNYCIQRLMLMIETPINYSIVKEKICVHH